MNKPLLLNPLPRVLLIITTIIVTCDTSSGDPRSETLEITCGKKIQLSGYEYIPNFVATMGNVSERLRKTGFGTAVTGSGVTVSYGLAQCSGDLSLDDCVLCYSEARTKLPQCYPHVGARIYLDGCFMRAEDYDFFQEYLGPHDKAMCGNETRKSSIFQVSATQAVMEATETAVRNGGYARAEVAMENESAYVVADCLKSVKMSGCKACLENASKAVFGCFPWSEGRALNTGCFMRYSDTDFLNPVPRKEKTKGSTTAVIVSVICSVAVLVIGGIIGYYIWKRRVIMIKRRVSAGSSDSKKLAKTLHDSALNFKYSTLENATASFDEENKLGQGGFGTVYKGVLHDGREIAVKRLFYTNKAADFYNEVNIISQLEHKNLVRLLGCSCSIPEHLLVYEFLPNLSLDRYIFSSERAKALNWDKRYVIIIGIAEGLVYLHENTKTKIVHRDVKASNVLLDRKMHAKISDFGLARTFQGDKSHISTGIAGTLGYMAPEYLAQGQLTEKADVYSFGVLLLEIISGRRNTVTQNAEYSYSLTTIAWKHFQQGKAEALIDPNLMLHDYYFDKNVKNEVLRVLHIGLLCTQESPFMRPTMSDALKMLAKSEEPLPPPNNPPFLDEYTMEFNDTYENTFRSQSFGYPTSVATMSNSSFQPR